MSGSEANIYIYMENKPQYLKEDECFYYCPKQNLQDLYQLEDFIPYYALLQGRIEEIEYTDNVRKAFFNVIGDIEGKKVIII